MSKSKDLIMNDRIHATEVRLIGEAGEQLGVKPTADALKMAEDAGVDLVLVAEGATPPVAKLMDYGKFKYRQKKRQHEHHRHQPEMKELRLRPKTEEHDLMVRVKQARAFIARGDRVLINLRFRGREMAHTELGRAVLETFARHLEDVAKVEKMPMMERRRMTMILAPIK